MGVGVGWGVGSLGHALLKASPTHLGGSNSADSADSEFSEIQDSATHLCTDASYTPLSPAMDSSDTAAETQATLRPHPWAVFIAGGKSGKRKDGKVGFRNRGTVFVTGGPAQFQSLQNSRARSCLTLGCRQQ